MCYSIGLPLLAGLLAVIQTTAIIRGIGVSDGLG